MAPKRKITLADIQGPGDKAQIDPRGSVRPARERIRPGRFQPGKDLLDFRGLSQTIAAAAKTVGQAIQKHDKQDQEDQAQAEFYTDIAQDTFEAIIFNSEMGEGSQGLGALPTDDQIQPGLLPIPDPTPQHLRDSAKEIGEGQRLGLVRPSQNPLTGRYSGEVLGTRGFEAFKKGMKDDSAELSQGEWLGSGRFQPNVDYLQRRNERFSKILEDNPRLDLRSGDADRRAATQMLHQIRQWEPNFREKVNEDLDTDSLKKHNKNITTAVHSIYDTVIDSTTKHRADNPDPAATEKDNAAAAARIDEEYQKAIDIGYDSRLLSAKQAQDVIKKATIIDSEFANSDWERRARLEQMLDVFEMTRMGGTGRAVNDADAKPAIIHIQNLLDSGGGGRRRGGSSSADMQRVQDNTELDTLEKAIEARDPMAVIAAEKKAKDFARNEAKGDGLRDGHELRGRLDVHRDYVKGMVERAGSGSWRKMIATFVTEEASKMAIEGNVDGGEERIRQMAQMGAISTADRQAALDKIHEIETGARILTKSLPMQAHLSEFNAAIAMIDALKMPSDVVNPLRAKIKQDLIDYRLEAGTFAFNTEAGGKDGQEVTDESLTSGALKNSFDRRIAPFREFIKQRNESLGKNRTVRKAMGWRFSADDMPDLIREVGEVEAYKIRDEVNGKLEDRYLREGSDSPLRGTWEDLGTELQADIAQQAGLAAELGSEVSTSANIYRHLLAKMTVLRKKMGNKSNAAQLSSPDNAWKSKLGDRWEKDSETIKALFPQWLKDFKEGGTAMQQIRSSDSTVNGYQTIGVTKSTFSANAKTAIQGLGNVKQFVDDVAWTNHLRSKYNLVLGGEERREADLWLVSVGKSARRIDQELAGSTEEVRQSLKAQLLQMGGHLRMEHIEAGGEASFDIPGEVNTPAAIAARKVAGILSPGVDQLPPITLNMDIVTIDPTRGPLFARHAGETQADAIKRLDAFVNHTGRVSAAAKKFKWGKIDLRRPMENGIVAAFYAQQIKWIRNIPAPR